MSGRTCHTVSIKVDVRQRTSEKKRERTWRTPRRKEGMKEAEEDSDNESERAIISYYFYQSGCETEDECEDKGEDVAEPEEDGEDMAEPEEDGEEVVEAEEDGERAEAGHSA